MPPKPVYRSSGAVKLSAPRGKPSSRKSGGKAAPVARVPESGSRGAVVVRAAPAGHRGAVRVIAASTPEERRLFAPMLYEPSWSDITQPWRRDSHHAPSSSRRRTFVSVDGLGQTADRSTAVAGWAAVAVLAAGIFWFVSPKKTTVNRRRSRGLRRNRYWYYA
jgi:hypothetical protein